jgi:small subunit ribosomal protein S8e
MKWQGSSRRKETGGRLKRHRGKKKYEMGREPSETTLGRVERRKNIRTRGGNKKIRLLRTITANVTDAEGNTKRVRIEKVLSNPANQYYVRRNIITKGAIIKTDMGNAKVTSRPGQDGVVNAIKEV